MCPPRYIVFAASCILSLSTVRGDEAGPLFVWKTWLVLDDAGDANTAIAFSPDGKLVAATDGGGNVKLWHVDDGSEAGICAGPAVGTPLAMAFAPDGTSLLLAARDGVVGWDIASRRQVAFFRWPVAEVEAAAFAPNGRAVAFGGGHGDVQVLALDGRLLVHCDAPAQSVLAVAFRPDTTMLATGGTDGTIRVWDLPSGEERCVLRARDKGLVRGLAFSPEGASLVSVGGRDGVTLWDIASESVRERWGSRPQPYWSVAFASDGATVAAGSPHGAVDLWDVADPERHEVHRAHVGLTREVKFADPITVASAGSDGTVHLWERGRRVAPGRS
jgi:WD40 repeat protein